VLDFVLRCWHKIYLKNTLGHPSGNANNAGQNFWKDFWKLENKQTFATGIYL
jgi:hypothetical protein